MMMLGGLKKHLNKLGLWRTGGAVACLLLLTAIVASPRLVLPVLALLCGILFFLYGVKSYASVAIIMLSTTGANGNGSGHGSGKDARPGLVNRLRNRNDQQANGGNGNGKPFRLPPEKQPFISIQLPMYNENRVVDRLLTACTELDYENYEVLVADDSSDQTLHSLERWAKHPKVRVSHRINRSGFKGAALKHASEVMNPKAEFVAVFDADFIPPPDILNQFLSYFYGMNPNGDGDGNGNGNGLQLLDESLAVVQGYQWHVLNASENWITRGIRAEFAGSYVIERSTQELTGGMKMISGSVFMMRADVLRQHKWGTSITEDWELTLRLYLDGYKVLYTPFIQAPAECVSDFKQLTRQRMRWAEGHTFNVKRFFLPVLRSPNLTLREKFEFIYYAPYYLTSVLFMLGTAAWLISELYLRVELPYWSELFGWSLVFTNAFALILMNLAGLFQERGVRRSWVGLFSFALLTFLLVPYQAYAALKGLLEFREGGWHRTRKSGVVTDVVKRLGLGRRMPKLMPKKKLLDLEKRLPAVARLTSRIPQPVRHAIGKTSRGFKLAAGVAGGFLILGLLAYSLNASSADPNRYFLVFVPLVPYLGSFGWKRRWRQLAWRIVGFMLAAGVSIWLLANQVQPVTAAPDTFYFHPTATSGITPAGEYMNNTEGSGGSTKAFNTGGQDAYWYADVTWPTGNDNASIAAGTYTLNMYFVNRPGAGSGDYPAVAATNTSVNNTNGTSHTVNLPSGISSGNLLIVIFGFRGGTNQTITWPSGYASFFRADQSTNVGVAAAYRQADGTEGTTITVTTSANARTSHNSYRITGAADPAVRAPESINSNGNNANPNPASLTPTGGAKDFLWIALEVNNAGTTTITGWPTSYTGGIQANGSSQNSTTGSAVRQLNAASEDPGTFTISSSIAWAAGTLVVHPAASVDIQVTVSHTASDGSGATTIVTSSTTTINASTADPYALNIGSGSSQTFTSSDPRRLRVRVNVVSVSSGGDFTLDYDGTCASSRCSNLDTPVVTVPEYALILLPIALLIPVAVPLLKHRRTRPTQVGKENSDGQ